MISFALGGLSSFLIGSLPTGYLIGKWTKGIDIRKYGSGNIGATNVFRIVGKNWGFVVLGLDALKGAAVVLVLSPVVNIIHEQPFSFTVISLLYGILSIAGHVWSPWLGFKGGKGVAASAGVFLSLMPLPALLSLLVWVVCFLLKRIVSLASLGAALTLPLWIGLCYRASERFVVLFPVSLALFVFMVYTHRANIKRLLNGEEQPLV